LQVFHTDIAKVDRDVTYVAMVVHICCKHLFVFRLFFQTYVASVFIRILHMFQHICCKCFIWMLRMFQMFHLSFFMFQVLLLDISKVDWVLHMRCVWEAAGARAVPARCTAWARMDAGDAGLVERHPGSAGPHVDTRKMDCSRGRLSGGPGASSVLNFCGQRKVTDRSPSPAHEASREKPRGADPELSPGLRWTLDRMVMTEGVPVNLTL
jgi:hypothetical protein